MRTRKILRSILLLSRTGPPSNIWTTYNSEEDSQSEKHQAVVLDDLAGFQAVSVGSDDLEGREEGTDAFRGLLLVTDIALH